VPGGRDTTVSVLGDGGANGLFSCSSSVGSATLSKSSSDKPTIVDSALMSSPLFNASRS
jgi:hypothetical protein